MAKKGIKHAKYSEEFKIKVVFEYLNGEGSFRSLALKYNISAKSTVYDWVKIYEKSGIIGFKEETRGRSKTDGTRKGRPKTNFLSLEEQIKYLKMENEYLKKLQTLQEERARISKYQIISQMKDTYSIAALCKVAKIQRSGYYMWLIRKNNINPNDKINLKVSELMIKAHKESKGTYGVERLWLYVNRNLDIPINHKRIYRLQGLLELKTVIRKKVYYKNYTPAKICENILQREFNADKPLKKLCMDVTYIPVNSTCSRFIYMNAVKDLFNGEIVAYDLSLQNDSKLISCTLSKLSTLPLEDNCILHTDQGAVYTRVPYFEKLKEKRITASMSRRGNCWDNAPIESFFSHFKSESIYLTKTRDYEILINEIHDYIKFYNEKRIQKKLNGLSPVEFRTKTA